MPSALPFHSPSRPTQASGRPAYPHQSPCATLPGITITPEPNGYRLSLWLVTAPNEAQEFKRFFGQDQAPRILDILYEYSLDPEGTMERHFQWPGVSGPRPKAQEQSLSLEELGL